jgi:hypothetical protein
VLLRDCYVRLEKRRNYSSYRCKECVRIHNSHRYS